MCGCGCNKSVGTGDPGVSPVVAPPETYWVHLEEDIQEGIDMFGTSIVWGIGAISLFKLLGYSNFASLAAGAGAATVGYLGGAKKE